MKKVKLLLTMVFILDVIPILFLFILKKGNFLAGSSLLFIYGFLWILKIPLFINIWKRSEMSKTSFFFLTIILFIFGYIQYLNYLFIFKTT